MVLVPNTAEFRGVSEILIPDHSGVASAFGAAIAKVSGSLVNIVELSGELNRSNRQNQDRTKTRAIKSGAEEPTVTAYSDTVPPAYLPGNKYRVIAKAIGQLEIQKMEENNPYSVRLQVPRVIGDE